MEKIDRFLRHTGLLTDEPAEIEVQGNPLHISKKLWRASQKLKVVGKRSDQKSPGPS